MMVRDTLMRPVLAGLLVLLAGCGPASTDPVASGGARVVSLAPSLTQTVFALAAEACLVGRTDYCVYPPEAELIESVGRLDKPDIERIIRLRPSLVLATELTPPDVLHRIERLGIEVVSFTHSGYRELIDETREIGAQLDASAAAERVAVQMGAALDQAKQRAGSGDDPPRVLLLYSLDGLFSAGRGSFPDDLIRLAGGHNLAAEAPSSWPKLNFEMILRTDPEVLLLTCGRTEPEQVALRHQISRLKDDPLWALLTAVREGRVHLIADDLLSVPGPRSSEALRQISAALYPR